MSSDVVPLRLIDTAKRCIVPAAKARYACSSYVWGQRGQLVLNSNTEAVLLQENSLSNRNSELPQTIKDSISFCQSIGIPYLWVDSLCIKQDSGKEMKSEIVRMHQIYSNAYVTLVALGSDAHAGLPGIRYGTRNVQQIQGTANGYGLIQSYPPLYEEIARSKWSTRCWTLQESYFSRRLFIFTPNQVAFSCPSSTFCEVTNLDTLPDEHFGVKYDHSCQSPYQLTSKSDNPIGWMIEEYTARHISNHADILNAFEGIMSYYKDDGPEPYEFLFGLPTNTFAQALCWTHTGGHSPARRRSIFPS